MEVQFEQLRDHVMSHNWQALKVDLSHLQEVDIASFIESLPAELALIVFRTLDKDLAAEIFANLANEQQEQLIGAITDEELQHLMKGLMIDDAVDMLGELPANLVNRILRHTSPGTRTLINQFLLYPEFCAGSIMTAEFVQLKKEMMVKEAIDHIRRVGENKETIYTCYVTTQFRKLEGIISVRTLLLSDDNDILETLMEPDFISVTTTDDQELVADLFRRYDLLSIPVVDHENRLVGIITVDDIIDVIEEENTEDFEKMGAMLPSDKPYLKTGVFVLAKNRIAWLMILLISGMITGSILARFEDAFLVLPILVSFIPMLTDTGGNAGSQSSTLIIRGMAVNEISIKDMWIVLFKELRVALLVGFVLAFFTALRVYFTGYGFMVALTVGIALYSTVVMAKTIGGILPMAAKKIHMDPAIMAAPLITTIVDAFSLILYFTIAKQLLHL
ncbi:MAG: magnesium transporter [Sphaerochaeta sp.]|jgi:magnesium transporter|nr:magnesium transporter [Sphaerochaeta sp.]